MGDDIVLHVCTPRCVSKEQLSASVSRRSSCAMEEGAHEIPEFLLYGGPWNDRCSLVAITGSAVSYERNMCFIIQ